MLWKCIFDLITNRGKRVDPNGPREGEYAVDIHSSLCGWFNVHPERYMWDGSALVAWPGWEDEELEKTKDRVWEQIKAERDRRVNGGFKVEVRADEFKWYHSDQKSRIQHLGLKAAGAAVPAIPWKTMDGSFEPMSEAIATAVFNAALALDTALFTKAEQHKALMRASADPEGYDFSAGWPERYEE